MSVASFQLVAESQSVLLPRSCLVMSGRFAFCRDLKCCHATWIGRVPS